MFNGGCVCFVFSGLLLWKHSATCVDVSSHCLSLRSCFSHFSVLYRLMESGSCVCVCVCMFALMPCSMFNSQARLDLHFGFPLCLLLWPERDTEACLRHNESNFVAFFSGKFLSVVQEKWQKERLCKSAFVFFFLNRFSANWRVRVWVEAQSLPKGNDYLHNDCSLQVPGLSSLIFVFTSYSIKVSIRSLDVFG